MIPNLSKTWRSSDHPGCLHQPHSTKNGGEDDNHNHMTQVRSKPYHNNMCSYELVQVSDYSTYVAYECGSTSG